MDKFLLSVGSALFMVFFFGFCIFIHELGHFLAAKWRGLYVSVFSIGFKKIWGFKYKGVDFRIGCLPFGGYVEIPQVDAKDSKTEVKGPDGKPLPPVKPLDMMITVIAGPLFNFLFGFALAVVIWIAGFPAKTPELNKFEVGLVKNGSPEYKAGLREKDVIIAINGSKFNTDWQGFVREILTTIGPVTLTVKRGNEIFDFTYTPEANKNFMPDEEIAYPHFFPKLPLMIYPEADSPAAKAGVRHGDRLIAINGTDVNMTSEIDQIITTSDGKPMTFKVERKGEIISVSNIIPEIQTIDGKDGRWMIGVSYSLDSMKVSSVVKDSPAERAGIKAGDVIKLINGKNAGSGELSKVIEESEGKSMKIQLARNKEHIEINIKPEYKKFYTAGLQFAYLTHPTPWKQFSDIMEMTWKSMRGIAVAVGNSIGLTDKTTTIKPRHASGPIGIGRVLYMSVYRGSFIQGLYLVVIVTFNLGLMNMLPVPIPVLDGGIFVVSLLEVILRRQVSPKILRPLTIGFIVLLIAFMLYVTFYDAKRLVKDFTPKEKAPPNVQQKINP